MRTTLLLAGLLVALPATPTGRSPVAAVGEPVAFTSPGFEPTQMDAQGGLVEDWGTVGIRLSGEGLADGPTAVEATELDGFIPAARAVSTRGPVTLTSTAYRAPVFPGGLDVLTVGVEETKGRAAQVTLTLDVPAAAQIGAQTVHVGQRTVVTLPGEATAKQELRDWGYCDEAVSLRAWAKPEGECDPAMRSIRAGMGGVPIEYRFAVKSLQTSEANVVLGFCESHWAEPARRPLVCRVEGAAPEQVDPVAKWGRHKPGAVALKARDENGDGWLQIAVSTPPGAADRNPILNAIWIFPAGKPPSLDKVVSGSLNAAAIRFVDVGGDNDQSIYAPGKLEYRLSLPAGGKKELVFLLACQGGSAPTPDMRPWTAESLRRAALEVWKDWPGK